MKYILAILISFVALPFLLCLAIMEIIEGIIAIINKLRYCWQTKHRPASWKPYQDY